MKLINPVASAEIISSDMIMYDGGCENENVQSVLCKTKLVGEFSTFRFFYCRHIKRNTYTLLVYMCTYNFNCCVRHLNIR